MHASRARPGAAASSGRCSLRAPARPSSRRAHHAVGAGWCYRRLLQRRPPGRDRDGPLRQYAPHSAASASAAAVARGRHLMAARGPSVQPDALSKAVSLAKASSKPLVRKSGYASRRGWSVHAAAVGVIARRCLKLSERVPRAGTDLRVLVLGRHEAPRLPAMKDRGGRQGAWPRGSARPLQQGPPFDLHHSGYIGFDGEKTYQSSCSRVRNSLSLLSSKG